VGVDEIEPPPPELPADRPARGEGIERRGERRRPLHPLVRLQAAAVAQHLAALRGVTEGDDLHAAVVPGGGHPFGVRRQHGHPVAAADQPAGEVADERAGRVPLETGVGLGEEEKLEGALAPHSSHSLIE